MTSLGPPDTVPPTDRLSRVTEMLNGHVMGPRVRAALGAPGRASCSVLDAKYEPGVRGTVLYRVGPLLVRGDLVDDPADGGDGFRPVVDPGVRLCRFPDDPDLPGLAAAADPERLRNALTEALPDGGPPRRCRVELVRYRPGKRATLAVEVRGPLDRGARGRRFVVKSYHDGRKAAAVAAEAVLLDATVDPAAPLRFAPVRAHVPQLSLVVQEHVPGVHLDQLMLRPDGTAAHAVRRAAVALAALHRQPVVSRRARSVDAELVRFGTRSSRVEEVDGVTGRALGSLAVRLLAEADTLPRGVVGLVHGDCKPSQFLLRGEEVVLLDLDSCGAADPAVDVGTFLATLRQQAVRRALGRRAVPSSAAGTTEPAGVFLEEYLRSAGEPPDGGLRRRIAWYEAVALERKALRCFARAPRSPLTRALVDEGHACLDRLGGTP
jgi:hypothetical protein